MLVPLACWALALDASLSTIPTGYVGASAVDAMTRDAAAVWRLFRDPANGAYCDHISLQTGAQCAGVQYSSAGTGMGLMIEATFAVMGLQSRSVGGGRVVQTLKTILTKWPREPHHGFYAHFTGAAWPAGKGQFSTVDTAEMVAGALFAGSFFGGEARVLANRIAEGVHWGAAIAGANDSTIFPVVDFATGRMTGTIRPYNEYFIVSYLASKYDRSGVATQFFATYFGGPDGHRPKGAGCGTDAVNPCNPARGERRPVFLPYVDGHGASHTLLTDSNTTFMSSFIPLFCWYMTKPAQQGYYRTLLSTWRTADQAWWRDAVEAFTKSSGGPPKLHGKDVTGRLWGSGAGQSPSGYGVERIGVAGDLVASAAIMAGFLAAAEASDRAAITAQLQWLYDEGVCAYDVPVAAATARLLWRCSLKQPSWKPTTADSIDLSTYILGLATNHLPSDFFSQHAA